MNTSSHKDGPLWIVAADSSVAKIVAELDQRLVDEPADAIAARVHAASMEARLR